MVRWLGTFVTLLVVVLTAVQGFAEEPASQAIDRFIAKSWARDKVQPAPASNDAEFIRRLYLDLIGRIPTVQETLHFIDDKNSQKRSVLIEKLLVGAEFPKHWRENLHVWLMGGPAFSGEGESEWRKWLEDSLKANKPWDVLVREIVLARPEKPEGSGASRFLVSRLTQGEPGLDNATRDVSRFFFGVDIQCARCHKHPDVKQWRQESYWGMAAFLKRSYPLAIKGKTYLAEKASGEVEYLTKARESVAVKPTFLTGETLPDPAKTLIPVSAPAAKTPNPASKPASGENPADYLIAPEEAKDKTRVPVPKFSRRERLVATGLNGQNPYFKRAAVNFVWSRLLGRGLVEPIDQMHDGNPASHPDLLQWLADDFVAQDFDLHHLIRSIVNSRTYQLSSRQPPGSPRPADVTYACAAIRPLSLHQLALALLVAAGYHDPVPAESEPAAIRAKLETKQDKLLAALMKNLDTGAEPFQPGVKEALYQTNSPAFADFVAKGGIAKRLAGLKDDSQVSREVYLAVFSRLPTSEETARLQDYLRKRSDRREQACEQIVWAFLTSSEFRFNH